MPKRYAGSINPLTVLYISSTVIKDPGVEEPLLLESSAHKHV